MTVRTTTNTAPTLSKVFSPATISAGGESTLTITLGNLNNGGGTFVNTLPAGALRTTQGNNATAAVATLTVITVANLTAPLTDTLPAGLVTSGRAGNTCHGTPSVRPTTVTLTGGSIPANGTCILTVHVTSE